MRLLIRVAALAVLLLAPPGAGCSEPWLALPDSDSATATFSPDGTTLALADHGEGATLSLFDLEQKRARWQTAIQEQNGVGFSAGGTYLVVGDQARRAELARVSVLRASDGEHIYGQDVPYARHSERLTYSLDAARRFSPSDDGAWLLAALEDGVDFVDLHTGKPARVSGGRGVIHVSIGPGSRRSAILGEGGRLAIWELDGAGTWREAVVLETAGWPQWVPGGVAFVSREAVELWDGKTRRKLAVLGDHPDDTGLRHQGPVSYVSGDGRHALVQTRSTLELYDLTSGRRLLEHPVESERPLVLCDAAFGDDLVRAFLCDGTLLEIGLADGTVKGERSFGDPGRYSRAFGHAGATQETRYVPKLGPGARFLDLDRVGKGHEIHRF